MASYRVVLVKTAEVVWEGQAKDTQTVIQPEFLRRRGVTFHKGVEYELQIWQGTPWLRLRPMPVRR